MAHSSTFSCTSKHEGYAGVCRHVHSSGQTRDYYLRLRCSSSPDLTRRTFSKVLLLKAVALQQDAFDLCKPLTQLLRDALHLNEEIKRIARINDVELEVFIFSRIFLPSLCAYWNLNKTERMPKDWESETEQTWSLDVKIPKIIKLTYFMLISMVRLGLSLPFYFIFFSFPWRNITKSKITSARVHWCQEFSLCRTQKNIAQRNMQHVPMLHQNRDASDISLLQNLIAGVFHNSCEFMDTRQHTKVATLRPWHHLTSYHRTQTVENTDFCRWPGIEVRRFTSPSCHPSQASLINKWTRNNQKIFSKWNKDLFNAAM